MDLHVSGLRVSLHTVIAWGAILAAAASSLPADAPAGEPRVKAQAGPEAGQGAWIVSPRSYWRYHYVFRPAQSYFPAEDKLALLPTRYGAKGTIPIANLLATEEPPADWAQADFDDSAWPVNRAPLPWLPDMDQDGQGPYSCHVIRKARGRTRFLVPDPAKVDRLTLEIKYHGGLIVFANGREVGRGNVAQDGALAAQGFAEPYPEDAYRQTSAERRAKTGGWGWWPPEFPYHRWRYADKPQALADIDRIEAVRTRTIRLPVPRECLRQGINVLAVENRLNPVLQVQANKRRSVSEWFHKVPHVGIVDMAMTAEPDGAVVSADLRPAGVQAWGQDIHQWTLAEDFLEPGVRPSRVVRMAAPRNGACSGQVVMGAERDLSAPLAVMGDLTGPNGAKLLPASVQVRWARPLGLKQVKGLYGRIGFLAYMPDRFLVRYRGAPADTWVAEWTDHSGEGALLRDLWMKDTMQLFDQLSRTPPPVIRGGTSQPVWVTVEVPRNALPGLYMGTLSLRAEGMDEARFEVRLQVFDFDLPAPRNYTAYCGVDESPWALARWAGVKLWSEEHWKLVEQAIAWAGKLGARVAGIPVIHGTELNNQSDGMVKWVKRDAGGYDFDFSPADRYLDLWRKHCHSRPDAIVYLALPADEHGRGGNTGSVTLIEPVTGQESAFSPPKANTAEGLKLWEACAAAIRAHLNQRGIPDANLHWGLFYDYIGENGLALSGPLAEKFPDVGWARSSHLGRGIGGGHKVKVTWNAAVRAEQRPPFARDGKVTPLRGWSDPTAGLLLPRADSDVNALSVLPPLWQLREVQEMPVTSTYRGFARICVDGWGRGSYFGPYNPWLTYPGQDGGLDGSIQLEVLREGLQETEARIFLEKQETLSREVQDVLRLRTERIWTVPPRPEGQRIAEYYCGWQEMSWDLYAAAAAVSGGKPPTAEDRARFFAPRPLSLLLPHQPLVDSGRSELAHRPRLDLTDAFLGHAQFRAHLLECQGLVAPLQAESPHNDLLLALVEPLQDAVHLVPVPLVALFHVVRIGAVVQGRGKGLGDARLEPTLTPHFVGDAPRKVLHDGPARVGAELVAQRVVEFLHGPHQRHVAVADQFEETVLAAGVPLGNGDHQAKVRRDDLVLDRHGIAVELLDAVHQRDLGARGVELRPQLAGLVLQVVHLAEQVGLLLAREQRHLVQPGQVRRKAAGRPAVGPGLPFRRRAQEGAVLCLGPHGGEIGTGDEVQRQTKHPLRAHLAKDLQDPLLGAPELPGQVVHRFAPLVQLVDLALGFGVQRAAVIWEHRRFRVLPVVLAEQGANRFHAPLGRLGQSPHHFRGHKAGGRHATRLLGDGFPLLRGHLAESRPAFHAIGVRGDEPTHRTFQKTHLAAVVENEPPAYQSPATPPGNRFRGDVQ